MTEYWLNTEWYNIHTKQKALVVAQNKNGVFTLAYMEPLLMEYSVSESNWSEALFREHWRTTDQDLAYDAAKTHLLGGHTGTEWVCGDECWCKGGSNETV
jgi:hypothetical protein